MLSCDPILFHTYDINGDWHIYFGFKFISVANTTSSDIIYFDGMAIRHYFNVDSFATKTSAIFCVEFDKRKQMISYIREDIRVRGFWENRLGEYDEILIKFGLTE